MVAISGKSLPEGGDGLSTGCGLSTGGEFQSWGMVNLNLILYTHGQKLRYLRDRYGVEIHDAEDLLKHAEWRSIRWRRLACTNSLVRGSTGIITTPV